MQEEEKKEPVAAVSPVEPTVQPEDPFKKLQEENEKLRLEANDFKDKYLRALAEIENTRKRLQREKLESQGFAIQNVVCDLLQPLDHLEVALHHAEAASPEIKHWALGFEMIVTQLKQVLQDHGVEPFESIGMQFDPHVHEAIETEEAIEVAPGTIVKEFIRGYKMGNRVIRPARVKVAIQNGGTKEEIKEENV